MDIKSLTYFLAVARELHFGRAATRVNIEQSPLSRGIIALEEEIGVSLINCIRGVILLPFDEGIRIGRRDAADFIPQLAAPEVSPTASFHNHNTSV